MIVIEKKDKDPIFFRDGVSRKFDDEMYETLASRILDSSELKK